MSFLSVWQGAYPGLLLWEGVFAHVRPLPEHLRDPLLRPVRPRFLGVVAQDEFDLPAHGARVVGEAGGMAGGLAVALLGGLELPQQEVRFPTGGDRPDRVVEVLRPL